MCPVGDPVRPVRPLGVLGARDPRSTRNPGQRRSEVRSSCLHRRPFGHWTGATTAGSGSVRIGRRRDPLHCLPCRDHVTVHLPACRAASSRPPRLKRQASRSVICRGGSTAPGARACGPAPIRALTPAPDPVCSGSSRLCSRKAGQPATRRPPSSTTSGSPAGSGMSAASICAPRQDQGLEDAALSGTGVSSMPRISGPTDRSASRPRPEHCWTWPHRQTLAVVGVDSPLETYTRLVLEDHRFTGWEADVEIRSPGGRRVHPDLADRRHRLAVQVDGAVHEDPR